MALVAVGVYLAARPARNPTALIGGPFALQTAGGKTVTDADFKGHPFLVYFGYTHCPDVCPSTLADIADALRKIPDAPIRVLFVTVDPERDSPAAMSDYVSSFDSRFVGLSGSPEQIAAAEKAYRVYARKGPPQSDGGYSMDHSSVVYLMDKSGAFVELLDLQRPAEDTAKELLGLSLSRARLQSIRIGTPAAAMRSLAWRTVNSPKWKIDAASTALAWPSLTPATRSSRSPTPPEAMTGMVTASATARVSAMSKPSLEPSRSIEVSRISPAPSAATSRA